MLCVQGRPLPKSTFVIYRPGEAEAVLRHIGNQRLEGTALCGSTSRSWKGLTERVV